MGRKYKHLKATGTDTRIVYGVGCTFWGSIYDIELNGALPACPHCGGLLFEMQTEAAWLKLVDGYAASINDSGYGAFVLWNKGQVCVAMNKENPEASYAQRRLVYEASRKAMN